MTLKKLVPFSLFFFAVLAGRAATVFYAGSPIPFHDEWYAVAQGIIIPFFEGHLSLQYYFAPNNEHIIALPLLLNSSLIFIENSWNSLTPMLINCILSALCLMPIIRWIQDNSTTRGGICLIFIIAGVFCSPLYYGNIIWGFQSQILLMLYLSVIHIHILSSETDFSLRWVGGVLAGLMATLCFASGSIAALSVLSLIVITRLTGVRWNSFQLTSGALSAVIFVFGLTIISTNPSGYSFNFPGAFHTLLHALSFPSRFFSYWGLLFWAPFVVTSYLLISGRVSFPDIKFPYGLAIWGILQALSISVTRSDPAIVLAPRYYDIFTVGILANGLLLLVLLKKVNFSRYSLMGLRAGVALWICMLTIHFSRFVESHTFGDIPVIADQSHKQFQLVNRFYNDETNESLLQETPFPIRTLPDAAFLNSILSKDTIESILPDYITSRNPNTRLLDLPWLGQFDQRKYWLRIALAVLCVSLCGLYILCLKNLVFEERASFGRSLYQNMILFGLVGLLSTQTWRWLISSIEPNQLVVPMKVSGSEHAQLFYDQGKGIREEDSVGRFIQVSDHLSHIKFALPYGEIKSLRFDPASSATKFQIGKPFLVNGFGEILTAFDFNEIQPLHQIQSIELRENLLVIVTEDDANDPQLRFTLSAPLQNLPNKEAPWIEYISVTILILLSHLFNRVRARRQPGHIASNPT